MTAAHAIGITILAAMTAALFVPRLGALFDRWLDRRLDAAWHSACDDGRRL